MYKRSSNPRILELTKTVKERAYRLSDLKSSDHKCVWCLTDLSGKRQKWCSFGCARSALAWARPTAAHGIRFLLYRQGFKCAHCEFSWRDKYLEAFQAISRKGYWRYPKIKTKRIDWLIRRFRRLLPIDRRVEVDHIEQVSLGGACLGLDNIQLLCAQCHKSKTKKDAGIRASVRPRKGIRFTEEHKEAMSKSRKGFDSLNRRKARQNIYNANMVPVIAKNCKTHEEYRFSSLTEAASELGLQISNISRVIKGAQGRLQHKGWSFRKG